MLKRRLQTSLFGTWNIQKRLKNTNERIEKPISWKIMNVLFKQYTFIICL